MPYLNGLINDYSVAQGYFANTHPSIGNYFMLTTGQIIRVLESPDEVVAKVVEFRRSIFRDLVRCPAGSRFAGEREGSGSAFGSD